VVVENGTIKLTMMIALMIKEDKRQGFLGEREFSFVVPSK
jgi:hypothetical protein